MTAKLMELAEQRMRLVARAATERADLARILASWRRPLAVADQGLVVVHYIRSYAVLAAGVATVVATLRAWRMAKWLQRGLMLWKMGKVVTRFLRRP
jgi:hypothetical protein